LYEEEVYTDQKGHLKRRTTSLELSVTCPASENHKYIDVFRQIGGVNMQNEQVLADRRAPANWTRDKTIEVLQDIKMSLSNRLGPISLALALTAFGLICHHEFNVDGTYHCFKSFIRHAAVALGLEGHLKYIPGVNDDTAPKTD
jgi:hypothetical protein